MFKIINYSSIAVWYILNVNIPKTSTFIQGLCLCVQSLKEVLAFTANN